LLHARLGGEVPVFALIALALTTAVAASGATSKSGSIAFFNNDGLHVVELDGRGLNRLRENGCIRMPPPCPDAKAMSWSPDGRRLAAVFGNELLVFDGLEGAQRRLPTGVDVNGAAPPAWSPDSRELAFLDLEIEDGGETFSDLHIIDVESGSVRRLTFERDVAEPAWAPGRQIVYSSAVRDGSELFVIDSDGRGRRQLTASGPGVGSRWPAWSPAGGEVAFIRVQSAARGVLHVIRADGGGLRKLSDATVDVALGHRPAWSPDGSRVAFSTSLNGRPSGITQHVLGRDLYVASADGSGQRRLTQSAERHVADAAPTWSPDGSRLAFESFDRDGPSQSAVYAVNADGTCEGRVAAINGWQPQWQPLKDSATETRECFDASVITGKPRVAGTVARFVVTVLNDGTQPLTTLRLGSDSLAATALSATSRDASCSVPRGVLKCQIPRLRAGEKVDVAVTVEGRVISRSGPFLLGAEMTFSVLAAEAEVSLSNNGLLHEVPTPRCTTRTAGGGVLAGTEFDDTICGRRGHDRIRGADGRDGIRAGGGNDVVDTIDGRRDVVRCGAGADTVLADAADLVARDCERKRVRRS
jgi:hypothetical protein